MAQLTAADIESGLAAIGRLARADGRLIEISVYGGSAIVLAFDFRRATRDVDVIVHGVDAAAARHGPHAGVPAGHEVLGDAPRARGRHP